MQNDFSDFIALRDKLLSETIKKELIPPETYRCVLYVDGGYRSLDGISGWGVHGYVGTTMESPSGNGLTTKHCTQKGYIDKKDAVELDGAELLTVVSYIEARGSSPYSLTQPISNNSAELEAIIAGLHIVKVAGIKQVHILGDSVYALRIAQDKIFEWSKNGWKGKDGNELANLELIKDLHEITLELQASGVQITYGKIKAHVGHMGNEEADFQATAAMNEYMHTGTAGYVNHVHDTRGYWNYKPDYHRFLMDNKWHFNAKVNSIADDGTSTYYIGSHGDKDIYSGKPIGDSTLAVAILKQPDPVLEALRETVAELDSITGIFIANLNNIFKPQHYRILQTDKARITRYYQSKDLSKGRLDLPNKITLLKEMVPPRLVFLAMEEFYHLEYLLKTTMAGKDTSSVLITEITDDLYEVDDTGKKPKYVYRHDNDHVLEVKYRYYDAEDTIIDGKININMGADTPKKNILTSSAGPNTHVYLVTVKETDRSYRYYTVMNMDGDWGIWSAPYANLKVII